MRLVDQFIAGTMFLIALYLVFSSGGTLNTVLNSAGAGVSNITAVLQGRGTGSNISGANPNAYTQNTSYVSGGNAYLPPTNTILGAIAALFGNAGVNNQNPNPYILY